MHDQRLKGGRVLQAWDVSQFSRRRAHLLDSSRTGCSVRSVVRRDGATPHQALASFVMCSVVSAVVLSICSAARPPCDWLTPLRIGITHCEAPPVGLPSPPAAPVSSTPETPRMSVAARLRRRLSGRSRSPQTTSSSSIASKPRLRLTRLPYPRRPAPSLVGSPTSAYRYIGRRGPSESRSRESAAPRDTTSPRTTRPPTALWQAPPIC